MAGNEVGDEVYLYKNPSKTGVVNEVICVSTNAAGSSLHEYIVYWYDDNTTTRIDERYVGSVSAKRYAHSMNIIKKQFPELEKDLRKMRDSLGWDWKQAHEKGLYDTHERIVNTIAEIVKVKP
jgi:hypothetical protein